MKVLVWIICLALYVLVTFFGLGPVLLADGSNTERMWTLAIVILLYAAISLALWLYLRKNRRS